MRAVQSGDARDTVPRRHICRPDECHSLQEPTTNLEVCLSSFVDLFSCYSTTLKDFITKLLEKKKSKRPFITDVIEAFPKNFKMSREVDLKNFEKY